MFEFILLSLNPGVERHAADKNFICSEYLSQHEIRKMILYPGRIFLPTNASLYMFLLATWRLALNLCTDRIGKLFTIPL